MAQSSKPAPRTALVTAVRGQGMTLAVGTDDGAKIGQTFRVGRDNAGAKIQISAVTAGESTANLLDADAGFTITVGDTATFLSEEPLAAPAAPPEPLPAPPAAEPSPPAAPATTGTPALPRQALVTSVMGTSATLNIGAVDGAVVGAVYALPLNGNIQARLQITEVRPNDSLASLLVLQEGFVPTVGSTARFVIVEALPLPPTTPAAIPEAPPAPVVPPTSPVDANGIRVAPAPVASLSGATATITAIEGQSVIISAGSAQGITPSRNLPILREGAIIGLLRLQVVNENSSSGIVLWRDESLSPIAAGDAVGILGASTKVGSPAIQQAATGKGPVSTPVKYETGAANFAVPKAERAYELLAALAASGLIKSQPASVFEDEGARRHNTSEDILFSRAQIAGFVREAMGNSAGEKNGRGRAAIALLSQDFRRDLIALGETPAGLDALRQGKRAIGVSGFSRATLAGGDTGPDSRDPFSESYGARRVQSGFDTRTNIFGQLNSNLSFYGSFDSGSDIRRGTNTTGTGAFNSNVNNFELRKAFVSYNADKLLRGLTINLGRKEFWWGVGQFGTSILSDVPGGLNSLSTRFERGSYRVEGLYAPLGRGPAGQQRAFYGQNFSVKVNNIIRVGTSATILTVDDTFNPKYFLVAFSPLSLFLAKPDNARDAQARANAVLSGYVEGAVGKGARVYGEILIDDLSRKSIPAIENRTGLLVGGRFFNPVNPAKAGFTAEFARYNSYTYLPFPGGPSDTPDYFYQYRGAPLGHPISPMAPTTAGGAETLRFEGYYMPLKNLRLFGGIEFSDINASDQNTAQATGRGFSRQLTTRFAASYNLSRAFTLTARAQQIRTDQPNFVFNEPSRKDRHYSLEIGRSF